jgi:hypothetical protein
MLKLYITIYKNCEKKVPTCEHRYILDEDGEHVCMGCGQIYLSSSDIVEKDQPS